MNIAIYGSCVSRDTCEFIAGSSVVTYVARQSVTSLIRPHQTSELNIATLDSPFQRRMVSSDLAGSGVDRILNGDEPIDVVLVDLIDERRGFWLFPNATTLTNSLEFEACGGQIYAKERGAKLIEFGSDEHFDHWKIGFQEFVKQMSEANLLDKCIHLDLEWARAVEGSPYPRDDLATHIGRRLRHIKRGFRGVRRNGMAEAKDVWRSFRTVQPTESEVFSDRGKVANERYFRYRKFANKLIPKKVTRNSFELRIALSHRWGPQPFHYRDKDYLGVAAAVQRVHNELRTGYDQ